MTDVNGCAQLTASPKSFDTLMPITYEKAAPVI